MAQIKFLLQYLILSPFIVHATRDNTVDLPADGLREYISQEVKKCVKRALSESNMEHTVHIASINGQNIRLIQQLKQEHRDEMVALKNDFESQIRDLRKRLDENSETVNDFRNGNAQPPHIHPQQTIDRSNRTYTNTMQSHVSARRSRKSASASLLDTRYSGRIRRADRQATVASRVAFFAAIEADKEHLGAFDNIIFEHDFTNIGNAYNSSLGTFTAPVAGAYVFTCTLSEINSQSWAHFTINGFVVAKFDLSDSANRQSSHTIVLNLQQGQIVAVQNTGIDKTVHGDKYSTFSGFLLYEGFTTV